MADGVGGLYDRLHSRPAYHAVLYRMRLPSRRAALVVVLAVAFPPAARAQAAGASSAGSISIPDSLFQPIRLPARMAYDYPPNEIYVPRFIDLIRRRDFDALERALDSLQADVRDDVKHEMRFSDAFLAAARDDSTVLAGINAWMEAKPRSAHARVAAASHHFATAWRRRGTDYLRNTPPESIQGMIEFATSAIEDAVTALQLDSTHLVAYEIAIGVTRLAGRHEEAARLLGRGLSIHRGSYALHRSFMLMLWPRWGGTEELMVEFGKRASQDAGTNPRLVTLLGAVYENRANDSTLAGNHAGAVRELNKAMAYGPERSYMRARGKAYFRLGAYEYAFNDLRAAMMERSQDTEVLEYYGRTLVELASRARPAIRPTVLARATEVLRLAVYLDPANPRSRAALGRAQQMAGQ